MLTDFCILQCIIDYRSPDDFVFNLYIFATFQEKTVRIALKEKNKVNALKPPNVCYSFRCIVVSERNSSIVLKLFCGLSCSTFKYTKLTKERSTFNKILRTTQTKRYNCIGYTYMVSMQKSISYIYQRIVIGPVQ